MSASPLSQSFATPGTVILESPAPGELPSVLHGGWASAFPWLVQGTTTRGSGDRGPGDPPFDLRLFGAAPGGEVLSRWRALSDTLGMRGVVHAPQVHGSRIHLHGEPHDGLRLASPADGHATRAVGLLLTVGTADCVPVFLVEPGVRWVAMIHAGWRGTAAGILDAAVELFRRRVGASPAGLHLHLGPSICGRCYEVGPEVHGALGLPEPEGPTPVDLRGVLAHRGAAAGVPPSQITRSGHCTRCGPPDFFSHRRGDTGRQVGFMGVRETAGDLP